MQKPTKTSRIGPLLLALLGAMLLILPFFAAAAPVTKEFRKEVAPKPGAILVLENLAGKVTVEGKKDGPVEILATIHAESGELLEQLPIEVTESGGRIEVTAKYPVDRHDVYRYAGEGSGGSGWGSTSTTYLGRNVKVVSGGSSRGVELWADFVLRLPPQVGATLQNQVGVIAATNVDGPLTARSGSGNVRIDGGKGQTTARSGSGDVSVRGRSGPVEARTGSGDVALASIGGDVKVQTGSGNAVLEDVTGSLEAHTGSGNLTLRKATGSRMTARTGSGEISLRSVSGSLEAHTGSGGIRGEEMVVAGSLDLDTGSGDVDLSGDFAGLAEARVGTGSGDVSLRMAKVPGMKLDLSSSSGEIRLDLPGTKLKAGKKFEMTTGDGAARVKVRTGSGDIRIAGM
ncbi:MAG TPA: DUF4097 family beta strand repeat-containing protein [Thermoanaerobaculia bacterium]|nr:DUF4097 family beta strand repeat-containing protein [Thermoanaerobaculia bacterium]